MTNTPPERRRRIEHAALLPEDDVRRRDLIREIEESSSSERDEWYAILSENEEFETRLRHVEVPSGLLERVRAVRQDAPRTRRKWTRSPVGMIAAAALLIATLAGVVWFDGAAGRTVSENAHKLAMLAALDHASRPALSVRTDDISSLREGLRPGSPFTIGITSPRDGATLIGGRVCSFGERPLIYTRWRDGVEDVAVYQVRLDEFALRDSMSPLDVDIAEEGSPVSQCRVRIWSEGEFAYVLVRDQHRLGG